MTTERSGPAARGDSASEEPVSRLLAEVAAGRQGASEDLYSIVYEDLRRIARRQLRGSRGYRTLQTTALVHEAYLRLARARTMAFNDRVHFFAVASRAMRQILIDGARRSRAAKRGAGAAEVSLDALEELGSAAQNAPLASTAPRGEELLALEAALVRLEALDPRLGKVVECRFYGGMTFEEVGELLGVNERTVKRDWRKARAYLHAALSEPPGGGERRV